MGVADEFNGRSSKASAFSTPETNQLDPPTLYPNKPSHQRDRRQRQQCRAESNQSDDPPVHVRPQFDSTSSQPTQCTSSPIDPSVAIAEPEMPPRIRTHSMTRSNADLVTRANDLSRQINWAQIQELSARGFPRWSRTDAGSGRDGGAFQVYSRQGAQRHVVVASGILHCSVAELLAAVQPANGDDDDDCIQKLHALHGDHLRSASLVHNVPLEDTDVTGGGNAVEGEQELTQLTVKRATFHKSGWFASPEEWCFLDALYRRDSGQRFTKCMASLRADDVRAHQRTASARALHNIVVGLYVEPVTRGSSHVKGHNNNEEVEVEEEEPHPEDAHQPPHSTRVYFYGELLTSRQFGFALPSARSPASSRAIKARLLAMAQSCKHLLRLIRRRRLGMQVLVNVGRVLPLAGTRCLDCARRLMIAKLCRVCGHGVCDSCSDRHERESQRDLLDGETQRTVAGRVRVWTQVEVVRVCHLCMARVDAAEYSELSETALLGPRLVAAPAEAAPPSDQLRDLLQSALLRASSPREKASVLRVIRCVLHQDAPSSPTTHAQTMKTQTRTPRPPLSETSSEEEHIDRLRKELTVKRVRFAECELAHAQGRSYQVQPSRTLDRPMTFPVPANDEQRVNLVREARLCEMGEVQELNIICTLAAREASCFASVVSVIDRDELYVAAASDPAFREDPYTARTDTFCTHSIMTMEPLLVPHPEADIRFSRTPAVYPVGLRFYCGFPIFGDDSTVIGVICCINDKTVALSDVQFTAIRKLAAAASRIIKVYVRQQLARR